MDVQVENATVHFVPHTRGDKATFDVSGLHTETVVRHQSGGTTKVYMNIDREAAWELGLALIKFGAGNDSR